MGRTDKHKKKKLCILPNLHFEKVTTTHQAHRFVDIVTVDEASQNIW